jgi:hypothetical protein
LLAFLARMSGGSSNLLKKASCLFQHTHRIKCDFSYAPKINDLTAIDFADTSMYRVQVMKFLEFQQALGRC